MLSLLDLMSNSLRASSPKKYQLSSVVYHHGINASGGHYTCDVYWHCMKSWLRIDDPHIKIVKESDVLKPDGDGAAYLLFYEKI
jgi:ubiquitin carboxyl-terminal hydrolase 10